MKHRRSKGSGNADRHVKADESAATSTNAGLAANSANSDVESLAEGNNERHPTRQGKKKKGAKRGGHLGRVVVTLACAFVILAGLHAARSILAPVFLATFFAVLLISPMNWLCRRGFSRVTALTVVILSVLVVGTGVVTVIGTQLTQFARSLPALRDDFNQKLLNYNLDLGDFIPLLKTEKPTEGNGEPQSRRIQPSRVPEAEKTQTSASSVHFVQTSLSNDPSPAPAPSESSANGDTRPSKTAVVGPTENNRRTENASNNTSAPNAPSVANTSNTPETAVKNTASPANTPGTTAVNTPGTEPHATVSAAAPAAAPAQSSSPIDVPRGFFDSTPLNLPDQQASSVPATGQNAGQDDTFTNWVKPSDAVEASSRELFKFVAGLTGELSVMASSAFIVTLLVIFMLLEASKLPKKAEVALRQRSFGTERVKQLIEDIRRYMQIKTFVSILVGVCVTIFLLITDVSYPFLWGFVAFLLNFIPNIGSVVAAIPPILLAMSERGLFIGCVSIVAFVAINCIIGYGVEPKLLGDGLDLSPLVVLLSLIFCGWLFGAVGMFLSPPLAVIIKIILQSFPETKWIAVLMANKIPSEKKEEASNPA